MTETKAARREARRAALKAEYDAKRTEADRTARRGTHDEIVAAVRGTNYKYAWDYSWTEHAASGPVEVEVKDGCSSFRATLLAGTPGWYAFEDDVAYDRYVWIGDEQQPAPGATIVSRRRHHIWACLVEVEGRQTIAIATKHD